MLKRKFWHKAQSMAEYALIIGVVAAALAAMGIFFRAGLQKKIFDLAQELSDRPYIPKMTNSSSSSTATVTTNESYSRGVTNVTYSETSTRSGLETVQPETWSGGDGGGDDGGGDGG
jgi:Flp pilus assembly pilin Flp